MVPTLVSGLPDYRTLQATAHSTVAYLQSGGGSLASAFKSEPACGQLS